MNITGWPYTITVNGDVEAGAAARITVDFATPPSDETLEQVRYAVESFVALAQAGGLGGDRVDPLRSTATLSTTPSPAGETSLIWDLTVIAIDPRSLAVLFNMLAFLGKDIRAVTVQAPGTGPRAPFSTEDSPPMWPRVPFAIDDDRAGPYIEVQIEFVQDVPSSEHETLIDAVETWLDCGSVQGYRDWTEPDEKSFLIPTTDPPFVLTDSTLVAHLQDNGIIEGSYDIIVNVLIKLHATTPVRSLEIL